MMLTIDQVIEYFEQVIAEDRLSGDAINLKHVQTAAGLLMSAAQAYNDKETAYRFRLLAAQAANKREEIAGGE